MAETKSIKYEPLYISLFRMIYQHPIISAAFLCFFCITVTTNSPDGKLTYLSLVMPSAAAILFGIFAGLYTMREKPRDTKNKFLSFGIMLFGVIAAAHGRDIRCIHLFRRDKQTHCQKFDSAHHGCRISRQIMLYHFHSDHFHAARCTHHRFGQGTYRLYRIFYSE